MFQRLSDASSETSIQLRQTVHFTKELLDKFLTEGNSTIPTKVPIYWFRTVKATESECFLYHILISMGKFNCEFELMSQASLARAFVHSRLFTSSENIQEQKASVNNLVRQYITEQLAYIPTGTQTFDRQLVAAYNIIEGLLLRDEIICESLPSALFTRLWEDCSEITGWYCKNSRDSLIESLHGSLTKACIKRLPTIKDL